MKRETLVLVVLCFAIYMYYRKKYRDHPTGPQRGLAPGIESPWLLALYFGAAIAFALLALSMHTESWVILVLFFVVCRYYWIYGRKSKA